MFGKEPIDTLIGTCPICCKKEMISTFIDNGIFTSRLSYCQKNYQKYEGVNVCDTCYNKLIDVKIEHIKKIVTTC